jgi:hypothetical protein
MLYSFTSVREKNEIVQLDASSRSGICSSSRSFRSIGDVLFVCFSMASRK